MVKSRIAVGLARLTLCAVLPSRGLAERCGGTKRPRDRRTDRVAAGLRERRSLVPSALLIVGLLFATNAAPACGQANGKLQLHFMNVGQGDGALLVSPGGETVLFDNGVLNYCDLPLSYLQQLGVQRIDYLIASHYHADHIGCTEEVLAEYPLQKQAYDRGSTYGSGTFDAYKAVSLVSCMNLCTCSRPSFRMKRLASSSSTACGGTVSSAAAFRRRTLKKSRYALPCLPRWVWWARTTQASS